MPHRPTRGRSTAQVRNNSSRHVDQLGPEPNGREPRYARLARVLAAEILGGQRPVGTLLPTEHELCRIHGVSRATVREALRRLQELGLISRGQGVGTRVLADELRTNYVVSAASAGEMMGYGGETRLVIDKRRRILADAELALFLGAPEGSEWLHLSGVRMISGAALGPLAVVDIYLAARCAAAADEPDLETTPVYQLAERVSGQRVSEIRQDITAHPLTATQARQLQGRAGAPGLQVTRQFLPETGFPLEVSRSVHPADRFIFSLRLRQS